jgi:diguanylate cyclase (GGDEF)-like protein
MSAPKAIRFLNYLPVRTGLILAVGLSLIAFVFNLVYPLIASFRCQAAADRIAGQHIAWPKAGPTQMLKLMDDNQLAWLIVVNQKGEIISNYSPIPDPASLGVKSQLVEANGLRYYDAVAVDPQNSQTVHAGFLVEPLKGLVTAGQLSGDFAIVLLLAAILLPALWYWKAFAGPHKVLIDRLERHLADDSAISVKPKLGALACEELVEIDEALETALGPKLSALRSELDEAQEQNKTLLAQQAELELAKTVRQEIQTLNSADRIFNSVLLTFMKAYAEDLKFGISFRAMEHTGDFVLNGSVGFKNELMPKVASLAKMGLVTAPYAEEAQIWDTLSALEMPLVTDGCRSAISLPVATNGKRLGTLCLIALQDKYFFFQKQRALTLAIETAASAIERASAFEKEIIAGLTDELTGYPNRKYLPMLVEELSYHRETGEDVSMLLIEGDDFIKLNQKFGRQQADALIKQFCSTISDCLHVGVRSVRGKQDMIVRYGAAQFLVSLPDCNAKQALQIGERIKEAIGTKTGWAGDLPNWTASVIFGTCPEYSTSPQELAQDIDLAQAYLRDQKMYNQIFSTSAVPKSFKSRRPDAGDYATLDSLNPQGLLQSLSAAKSTCMVEAIRTDGTKLSMYCENGVPKKARIGSLVGDVAFIEFLTTFDSGKFQLKDLDSELSKDTEILRSGNTCDITLAPELAAQAATNASAKMDAARLVITSPTAYPLQERAGLDEKTWELLGSVQQPPTLLEVAAMREIFKLSVGRTPLNELFQKLDSMPTYLKWHATAILLREGLIKLSSLKVYA